MFYDPALFPFTRELQARWRFIRQEYLELEAPRLNIHRNGAAEEYAETLFRNNGWTPSWQVDSNDPHEGWTTYALSYKGMLPDEAPQKLPATSRLLARLRGCEVCAFSRMEAGAFIAPHSHPELAGSLLTLHLGLDLEPRRSYICVEGQTREEDAGRIIVFDGSREHFAVNMSQKSRTILYMEFNPTAVGFAD